MITGARTSFQIQRDVVYALLLRELAGLFAKHVRSFDLVAKYGGDEFTLILPQTDPEGALVVAERMRSVVSNHTFPLAEAARAHALMESSQHIGKIVLTL